MAIKLDLATTFGVTIPNTYIRIDRVEGNKTHINLTINAYNIAQEDEVYFETEEQEVTFTNEEGTEVTEVQNVRVEKTRQVDVLKLIEQRPYVTFIPTLDGDNFIAQGYEYLKTLADYVDSVDC